MMRLNRRQAWGPWFRTMDGADLVHDTKDKRSGSYYIEISVTRTREDAIDIIKNVVAQKLLWMEETDMLYLCKAMRAVTGFADLPDIPLATEPAYGHIKELKTLAESWDD